MGHIVTSTRVALFVAEYKKKGEDKITLEGRLMHFLRCVCTCHVAYGNGFEMHVWCLMKMELALGVTLN